MGPCGLTRELRSMSEMCHKLGGLVPQAEMHGHEPLHIAKVETTRAADDAIAAAWERVTPARRRLVPSVEAFQRLIREVLSQDIRALRMRVPKARVDKSAPGTDGDSSAALERSQMLHVLLLGVDLAYEILASGIVLVQQATLTVP